MAAAFDLSAANYKPSSVKVISPIYPVLITPAEIPQHEERAALDVTPIRDFELYYNVITEAKFNALRDHWDSALGTAIAFSMTNLNNYIARFDGANTKPITVRYVSWDFPAHLQTQNSFSGTIRVKKVQ